MPFDEGVRFDDDECFSPIEKAREHDHGQARGLCYRARLCFAFLEEGELFSEEQVLGDQLGTGGEYRG